MIDWRTIRPEDAKEIDLTERLDITAPLNEQGERCPWPWEPQELRGAPIGQYHCAYCGAMVLAGVSHLDYAALQDDPHAGDAGQGMIRRASQSPVFPHGDVVYAKALTGLREHIRRCVAVGTTMR